MTEVLPPSAETNHPEILHGMLMLYRQHMAQFIIKQCEEIAEIIPSHHRAQGESLRADSELDVRVSPHIISLLYTTEDKRSEKRTKYEVTVERDFNLSSTLHSAHAKRTVHKRNRHTPTIHTFNSMDTRRNKLTSAEIAFNVWLVKKNIQQFRRAGAV